MRKLLTILVFLISFPPGVTVAGNPRADIHEGLGIRGVFRLGDHVEEALSRFQERYAIRLNPKTYESPGGTIVDTGLGVELRLTYNKKIRQIIVYDPNLVTRRYIHVYSHQDDVLYSYGNSYDISRTRSGYYLRYSNLGIGFDVDDSTLLVRAIIIFHRH
jgi:hypothetical protein